jgi:hypothetical protein
MCPQANRKVSIFKSINSGLLEDFFNDEESLARDTAKPRTYGSEFEGMQ